MMTLRDAMTWLCGIGSLFVAATSCAAAPLPAGAPLHDRAAGYDVQVLVDGVAAPTYAHDGETYVLGQLGARYTLRVNNHSPRRIEAVVSVDGRDVVDGKPAAFRNKRGYLVPAYGQLDIDGWRISNVEAAAFRFSTVPDSYAARTGSAREVGVIGVAVFPERYVAPAPPARPPMPIYPRYPMAPESYRDDIGGDGYGTDRSSRGGGDEERIQAEAEPMTSSRSASPPTAGPADSAASAGSAQPYAERAPAKKAARARAGLGTEYGEAVSSPIYEVQFVRANPGRPSAILGLRYDDRGGLLAMGIDVDGNDWAFAHDEELRRTAQPFPAAERRYAAPPSGWRRECCMR